MKSPKNDFRKNKSDGPLKLDGAHAKRIASDRIADDLNRFERSGGTIEVLGTTRVLKKLDEPATE